MWTGDFVKLKSTGEKGRITAVYPAQDGVTVKLHTPQGERLIDLAGSGLTPEDGQQILEQNFELSPRKAA